MKSVLLSNLSFFGSYGGVENSIRFLVLSFLQRGIKVTVLCGYVYNNSKFHRVLAEENVYYYQFRYKPFKSSILNKLFLPFSVFELVYTIYLIKKERGITDSICRNQFVCFFINLFFPNNKYLAPGFSFFQSSKSYLGTSGFIRKVKNKVHNFFDLQAVIRSSEVVVFSENMRFQATQLLKNSHHLSLVEKIDISKPGVDSSVFHPIEKARKKVFREDLGLPTDKLLVLAVGRCVAAKGFEIAIRAMEGLRNDVMLIVVGDGLLFDTYKKLVHDLNLNESVILVGSSDSVSKFYQMSDYYLMSSIYEPLGQTTLEAIACGLPVIAFHNDSVITATNEILGDTAFTYVNSPVPSALREALCALPSTDSLSYIGKSGASLRLASSFTWDKLGNKLVD